MNEQLKDKKAWTYLYNAVSVITGNKIVLFPFFVLALLQVLILEILYFIPRYPLVNFLGPVISKTLGAQFLHYPYNLVILPKIFYQVNIPVFILLNSFFTIMGISIINQLNVGEKASIKKAIKDSFSAYIFAVVFFALFYFLVDKSAMAYQLLINRAQEIQSTQGIFFVIKKIVLGGGVFFSLFSSVIFTVIFAYILPAMVVDKKKILGSVIKNFKVLWGSLFFTFGIVFFPALLSALMLVSRVSLPVDFAVPELRVAFLVLNIFVTMIVEVVTYTALTMYYLVKKEG